MSYGTTTVIKIDNKLEIFIFMIIKMRFSYIVEESSLFEFLFSIYNECVQYFRIMFVLFNISLNKANEN